MPGRLVPLHPDQHVQGLRERRLRRRGGRLRRHVLGDGPLLAAGRPGERGRRGVGLRQRRRRALGEPAHAGGHTCGQEEEKVKKIYSKFGHSVLIN